MNIMGGLLGFLSSALSIPITLLKNMFTEGMKMTMSYHKQGIAFAREAGLTLQQAQAYTKVLTERATDLGQKYGIAAEEVQKLERNLANATGRMMMLSNADAERFVQINKLVGEATAGRFSEEIIRNMGGQISTVEGAVSKAYATAAKSGLDASKFAERVAQSLSMANRLSFRNGINGVTRMVALSEKLGINMQSVESAAGNFMELDKAIQNAAHLQMLGGSAAVNFGNPLTAAYEANYDPEAFAKRMSDSLASYAQFDAKTGISHINGMNMDFVRGIAQAMGISVDDASRMAKKNAEVKYKENNFSSTLRSIAGNDAEMRDMLLNRSHIRNGQMYLTTSNGKEMKVSDLQRTEEGRRELQTMRSLSKMTDEEIMEQQAKTLISIDEQIKGIMTSLSGEFAKKLQDHIPKIQEYLKKTGNWLIENAKPIADNVGKLAKDVVDNLPKIIPTIEKIGGFIIKATDFLSRNWPLLLAAIVGKKVLGTVGGWMFGGLGFGSRAARRAASSGTGTGFWGRLGNGARAAGRSVSNGARAAGSAIASGVRSIGNALTSGAKSIGNSAVTGAKNIGGAIATGVKGILNFGSSVIKDSVTRFKDVKAGYQLYRGANGPGSGLGRASSLYKGMKLAGPISKLARGTGILNVGIAAVQGGIAIRNFSKNKAALDEALQSGQISQNEYNTSLRGIQDDRNKGIGGAVGAAALGTLGAAIGGPLGAIAGGFIGEKVGGFIGKNWNNITDGVKKAGQWFGENARKAGVWLGGRIKAGANAMVRSAKAFAANVKAGLRFVGSVGKSLFNASASVVRWAGNGIKAGAQRIATRITAKPVGGREYIYTPNSTSVSNVNGHQVTVKDFNVNITGTIKLDAGKYASSIDARQLLNDRAFVSSIKDMIKESINRDMNGGRFMNDISVRRGQTHAGSGVGRL